MNLTFEHPWALLLLLLALPLAWMAWRSVRVLGAWKSYGALALRIVVLLLLTFALSRPSFVRESDAMSVLVVADESDSVPLALRRKAEESVREAVGRKPREDDRVGVVTVARDPIIAAMPAQLSEVVLTGHVGDMQATDLAGGLRMALATQPPDTTARVLLLSDGNETSGSLLEAADLARAAGVPIDVVPLEYQHASEVLVESLRAPTRAREGQSIDLRAVIRSQKAAKGKLMLWQNDEPVDLDPDSDSLGLPVDLQPGPNLITLPVVANGTGAQRFRVLFEPADPAMDIVPQNNAGAAVVFVGGTGRVLVIAPEGGQESNALETALREGKIEVERLPRGGDGARARLPRGLRLRRARERAALGLRQRLRPRDARVRARPRRRAGDARRPRELRRGRLAGLGDREGASRAHGSAADAPDPARCARDPAALLRDGRGQLLGPAGGPRRHRRALEPRTTSGCSPTAAAASARRRGRATARTTAGDSRCSSPATRRRRTRRPAACWSGTCRASRSPWRWSTTRW